MIIHLSHSLWTYEGEKHKAAGIINTHCMVKCVAWCNNNALWRLSAGGEFVIPLLYYSQWPELLYIIYKSTGQDEFSCLQMVTLQFAVIYIDVQSCVCVYVYRLFYSGFICGLHLVLYVVIFW